MKQLTLLLPSGLRTPGKKDCKLNTGLVNFLNYDIRLIQKEGVYILYISELGCQGSDENLKIAYEKLLNEREALCDKYFHRGKLMVRSMDGTFEDSIMNTCYASYKHFFIKLFIVILLLLFTAYYIFSKWGVITIQV